MSVGEDRVRVKFNPSANGTVDQIKQKSAELINLISDMPKPDYPAGSEGDKKRGEFSRLVALAMTHYEDAAMWAVKAATSA